MTPSNAREPASRPGLPQATVTRFAPAPTGRLHLGHLANAIYVWGLARRFNARVVLRIEDHDRQRCRPEYEAALLDDLDRLGIAAAEPSTDDLRSGRPSSFRQGDMGPMYEGALATLEDLALAYGCDCTRSTFAAWRAEHGASWSGPGCPGGCRQRGLARGARVGIRVFLGDGDERWVDLLRGPSHGPVAPAGDLLIRDRNGNWTYALCVVVDDHRHRVDLVVRGEDLVDATGAQIRLGQTLGRPTPPAYAHHPLVLRPDGSKLSKADGDTAIGDLLDAGQTRDSLFGEAAARVGLLPEPRSLSFDAATALVRGSSPWNSTGD
ncbi:MAG TPA: glutamate--tRNA ligase family protein [Candidatus Limnocylindria bacterium]|nr:glutamate--tRNA ligase family protein [Candidatus Limnocylindria bacterium]